MAAVGQARRGAAMTMRAVQKPPPMPLLTRRAAAWATFIALAAWAAGPAQAEAQAQMQAQTVPAARAQQSSLAMPAAAQRLLDLVNQHRQTHGLPAVRPSATLTAVAEAHVRDLALHPRAPACNLHSWSDRGPWTPCCYTVSHAQARCMWRKPAELSAGRFQAEGFELAAWTSEPITPEAALAAWRGSPEHEAMVLNRGVWRHSAWASVGVALAGQHAVLWFSRGREAD